MTSGNNLKRLLMGEEATGLLYISDRLLRWRIVACGRGQRSSLPIEDTSNNQDV